MKKLLSFLLILITLTGLAQNVLIEPYGISPNRASGFNRASYEEILATQNPEKGEAIYDTTFNRLRVYNGTEWVYLMQNSDSSVPSFKFINTGAEITNLQPRTDSTVICTIFYSSGATLGSTTISNISSNYIIAEFDIINEAWLWYETMYLASAAQSTAIAVKGDTLILGLVTYDDIYLGSNSITTSGDFKGVIGSYNLQTKNWNWVKDLGINYRGVRKVAIDKFSNIYMVGEFWRTINSDSFQAVSNYYPDSFGIYAQKLTPSGVTNWLSSITSSNGILAHEYGVDDSGYSSPYHFRLLSAITFEGEINFNGTVYYPNGSGKDVLILDLVRDTQFTSNQVIGGGGDEIVHSVSVSKSHPIDYILAGGFSGEANFGTSHINFQPALRTAVSERDGFVAHYTTGLVGAILIKPGDFWSSYLYHFNNNPLKARFYSFNMGNTLYYQEGFIEKRQTSFPIDGDDLNLFEKYLIFRAGGSIVKQIR